MILLRAYIRVLLLLFLSTITLPAIAADDDAALAAARSATVTQMKEIGLALQNHHDVYKQFPPRAVMKSGKPLLSWRVKILPFLGMQELFERFRHDEPWDSEHNKPLVAEMPDVYRCPRSNVGDQGLTVYQVPRGPDTVFASDEGTKIRSITDGTSKTIMFVEVDDRLAEPWTKPADWTFKPADPKAGLGGHFPGIFCAGFCDASVRGITLQIKEDDLNALFTRNGREAVKIPD